MLLQMSRKHINHRTTNIHINPTSLQWLWMKRPTSNIHLPNLSVWFRQYQWFIPLRKWYAWYCGGIASVETRELRPSMRYGSEFIMEYVHHPDGRQSRSCLVPTSWLNLSVEFEVPSLHHSWSWFQHRAMKGNWYYDILSFVQTSPSQGATRTDLCQNSCDAAIDSNGWLFLWGMWFRYADWEGNSRKHLSDMQTLVDISIYCVYKLIRKYLDKIYVTK